MCLIKTLKLNKNCEDVSSSFLAFIKGEWSAIESHLCSGKLMNFSIGVALGKL